MEEAHRVNQIWSIEDANRLSGEYRKRKSNTPNMTDSHIAEAIFNDNKFGTKTLHQIRGKIAHVKSPKPIKNKQDEQVNMKSPIKMDAIGNGIITDIKRKEFLVDDNEFIQQKHDKEGKEIVLKSPNQLVTNNGSGDGSGNGNITGIKRKEFSINDQNDNNEQQEEIKKLKSQLDSIKQLKDQTEIENLKLKQINSSLINDLKLLKIASLQTVSSTSGYGFYNTFKNISNYQDTTMMSSNSAEIIKSPSTDDIVIVFPTFSAGELTVKYIDTTDGCYHIETNTKNNLFNNTTKYLIKCIDGYSSVPSPCKIKQNGKQISALLLKKLEIPVFTLYDDDNND